MEDLRYPIGKFSFPETVTSSQVEDAIQEIADFPALLRNETSSLDDAALNQTYRPDGWTIRQVVHHCADSHLNSIMRFKLSLTEDEPSIRPYKENLWAELEDVKSPIILSLDLLEALHKKWVVLLKTLSPSDLKRTYFHPEANRTVRLDQTILLYAWHGKHHLAHVRQALQPEPS